MSDHCCAGASGKTALNDPRWRRILWAALLINAAMFGVEIVAGVAADSRALQADALDFLGDAANYAISLGVAGMALAWRARAAMVKAVTMLAFGLWVLGSAVWGFIERIGAACRDDGIDRRARPHGQCRGRADALSLSHRRREHALGLDLLAQRRDRQCRGDGRRARRVRHRAKLARPCRGRDHGDAGDLGQHRSLPSGARGTRRGSGEFDWQPTDRYVNPIPESESFCADAANDNACAASTA